MKIPRFVIDWLPVIAWMCLIFAGSTDLMSAEHTSRFLGPLLRWLKPDISSATLNAAQLAIRKAAHVTEYAILAGLLWRAARHSWTLVAASFWKSAAFALFAATIHAAVDEFHQSFVPSRTAMTRDVMIDICGALLGLLICWIVAGNNRAQAHSIA